VTPINGWCVFNVLFSYFMEISFIGGGLEIWYLTPLSTLFRYIVAVIDSGGCTRWKV